jgi:hypothetical protein
MKAVNLKKRDYLKLEAREHSLSYLQLGLKIGI